MLSKLLKYDLKYMIKNMSVFYILTIFFAITTKILFEIDQSFMVSVMAKISLGFLISMIANVLINTMMRSWIRFRDSLYKDESYLTHTLPVKKSQIYESKFIQTLIFSVVGFAVVLLALFIAFYSKENWAFLTNYLNIVSSNLNMSTFFFVVILLLIIFLEIFNAIQCGILGIILGYKRNNGKIGYSVLFGFILYLVSQMLVLALIYVYGLFDSSVMDLFNASPTNINVDAFKLMGVISSLLYIILIFIINIICVKELNKGVNIE